MRSFKSGNSIKMTILVLLMSCQVQAAALGSGMQSWIPSADGQDFPSIRSSRNLSQTDWFYSFYLDYAKNSLLIYEDPIASQIKAPQDDTLTSGHLQVAYGISHHLQIGLAIPSIIDQTVNDELYKKVFVTNGPVSLRSELKYSFVNSQTGGLALIGSFDLPNAKNDPYLGKASNLISTIDLVWDQHEGGSGFGLNFGYKMRTPGRIVNDAPMYPLDDQWVYSAGYYSQMPLGQKNSWSLEMLGSLPAKTGDYKHSLDVSSNEVVAAITLGFGQKTSWVNGVGIETMKGSLSPEFRIFMGLLFEIPGQRPFQEPLIDSKIDSGASSSETLAPFVDDSDDDGVSDRNDDCPETPEGVSVDHNGCPADQDQDGVIDSMDKCLKTRKGDVVDKQGCSVLVDDDYDGIPNGKDLCPKTESGVRVDIYGCPKKLGNKKNFKSKKR